MTSVVGVKATKKRRLALELHRASGLSLVHAQQAVEVRLLLPHLDGLLEVELAAVEQKLHDARVLDVVVLAEEVAHAEAQLTLRHLHVEHREHTGDLAQRPPVQVHHAALRSAVAAALAIASARSLARSPCTDHGSRSLTHSSPSLREIPRV
eukprot:CAMPEP_0202102722 /NCGR_PEP_ID=MMETSP0965-20130614/4474_1 /ASSEMBLY_ACC=CAM_ASM_000507 /TAXON_ID=4773 /ORGANISM="Schizochytrium aggregatum, Strain ATCC28209" /LENGTH=151 /DNA_ID=CAMNT_0048671495 /DNA_START=79 /DNA_END=532 /DNA_ORIENTATION=+